MHMRNETAHAQYKGGGCKKSDAGADEKLRSTNSGLPFHVSSFWALNGHALRDIRRGCCTCYGCIDM